MWGRLLVQATRSVISLALRRSERRRLAARNGHRCTKGTDVYDLAPVLSSTNTGFEPGSYGDFGGAELVDSGGAFGALLAAPDAVDVALAAGSGGTSAFVSARMYAACSEQVPFG